MSGSQFPAAQKRPFHVSPALGLSPCDECCLAGEVTITLDARGRHVERSGELVHAATSRQGLVCARDRTYMNAVSLADDVQP